MFTFYFEIIVANPFHYVVANFSLPLFHKNKNINKCLFNIPGCCSWGTVERHLTWRHGGLLPRVTWRSQTAHCYCPSLDSLLDINYQLWIYNNHTKSIAKAIQFFHRPHKFKYATNVLQYVSIKDSYSCSVNEVAHVYTCVWVFFSFWRKRSKENSGNPILNKG